MSIQVKKGGLAKIDFNELVIPKTADFSVFPVGFSQGESEIEPAKLSKEEVGERIDGIKSRLRNNEISSEELLVQIREILRSDPEKKDEVLKFLVGAFDANKFKIRETAHKALQKLTGVVFKAEDILSVLNNSENLSSNLEVCKRALTIAANDFWLSTVDKITTNRHDLVYALTGNELSGDELNEAFAEIISTIKNSFFESAVSSVKGFNSAKLRLSNMREYLEVMWETISIAKSLNLDASEDGRLRFVAISKIQSDLFSALQTGKSFQRILENTKIVISCFKDVHANRSFPLYLASAALFARLLEDFEDLNQPAGFREVISKEKDKKNPFEAVREKLLAHTHQKERKFEMLVGILDEYIALRATKDLCSLCEEIGFKINDDTNKAIKEKLASRHALQSAGKLHERDKDTEYLLTSLALAHGDFISKLPEAARINFAETFSRLQAQPAKALRGEEALNLLDMKVAEKGRQVEVKNMIKDFNWDFAIPKAIPSLKLDSSNSYVVHNLATDLVALQSALMLLQVNPRVEKDCGCDVLFSQLSFFGRSVVCRDKDISDFDAARSAILWLKAGGGIYNSEHLNEYSRLLKLSDDLGLKPEEFFPGFGEKLNSFKRDLASKFLPIDERSPHIPAQIISPIDLTDDLKTHEPNYYYAQGQVKIPQLSKALKSVVLIEVAGNKDIEAYTGIVISQDGHLLVSPICVERIARSVSSEIAPEDILLAVNERGLFNSGKLTRVIGGREVNLKGAKLIHYQKQTADNPFAIIQIPALAKREDLSTVSIAEETPKVGEMLYSVSYPNILGRTQHVSCGRITNLQKSSKKRINTYAPLMTPNSEQYLMPAFNSNGELTGVRTYIANNDKGFILSASYGFREQIAELFKETRAKP